MLVNAFISDSHTGNTAREDAYTLVRKASGDVPSLVGSSRLCNALFNINYINTVYFRQDQMNELYKSLME